jgi:glutamate-1-semialdehyde 2,1-aminomutase
MDELAPLGPVYQAGTLSGNPLATAAGLAVLAELDALGGAAAYERLEATTRRLVDGLGAVLADTGLQAQVPRAYTLAGIAFTATEVRDYDDARRVDSDRYGRFFHGLLERGVYLAPSAFETMFPSLAHTDADIDRTLAAAAAAARAVS